MYVLSILAVVLLSVCSTLAQYVRYETFPDGTYGYANYWPVGAEPSAYDQAAYAQAGYDEMINHGADRGIRTPNTMSAAYWPNANGRGGTMILHSSIRGGQGSSATDGYLNACNIGGHRYRGMCGEIANMAWAKSLHDEGHINTNSRVRWAVFGVVNKDTGATDWMGPCGTKDGSNGCTRYVDRLARQSGGGGTCIRKREPAVVAPVKPVVPVKPKPPVGNGPDAAPEPLAPGSGTKDPAAPNDVAEPLVPGSGIKDPAAPNDAVEPLVPGSKTPDEPASLNGEKDPVNSNGDKNPDDPAVVADKKADEANSKREFEEGAVCKLPVRKTGSPADIPDPSGLANFAPPPDKNPTVMRIRQVGQSYRM